MQANTIGKLSVLVVDDSALVRQILKDSLSRVERIAHVDTANDPYMAREKIVSGHFDVITLDVEMPRMDGLTFLRYLMRSHPMPVVVLSALTKAGSEAAMEALSLGAVDVVPKPGGSFSAADITDLIVEKVIAAAHVAKFTYNRRNSDVSTTVNARLKTLAKLRASRKVVALGASTGGPVAVEKLVTEFAEDLPPAFVVIHMPPGFTKSYADRLDRLSRVQVFEAEDGQIVGSGMVAIAPGNFHLTVEASGKDFVCRLNQIPRVLGQRPAVDVLFHSLAQNVGRNVVAALLTGMGRDGAQGLLQIKKNGGETIAQDEETSIVFGMPKEAIDLGAADHVLPIEKINAAIEASYRKD